MFLDNARTLPVFVSAIVKIRQTPEVYERWRGGNDMVAAVEEDFDEPDDNLLMDLLVDELIDEPVLDQSWRRSRSAVDTFGAKPPSIHLDGAEAEGSDA